MCPCGVLARKVPWFFSPRTAEKTRFKQAPPAQGCPRRRGTAATCATVQAGLGRPEGDATELPTRRREGGRGAVSPCQGVSLRPNQVPTQAPTQGSPAHVTGEGARHRGMWRSVLFLRTVQHLQIRIRGRRKQTGGGRGLRQWGLGSDCNGGGFPLGGMRMFWN